MEKRLLEIKARKSQLRGIANDLSSEQIDAALEELKDLDKEEKRA